MNTLSNLKLRKQPLKTMAAALLTVLLLVALPVASAFAADSGFLAPTANVTGSGSYDTWNSPQNGYASDNNRANGSSNDAVDYYGFTFPSLPAGTVIDGIQVSVEGYDADGRDADVQLSWNSGTTWTSGTGGTKTTNLPTSAGAETATFLGGATDKWGTGHTWVPGDFTGTPNTSFRVRLIGTSCGMGCDPVYVDQVQVKIYYTLPTFTLTYNAGTGGTITGTTPQIVTYGQNGTAVTAVPNTGYDFVSWSDGVLTATRQELNVTANKTVTANFAIKQYTLTYNAGTGGSIVGTNPQTVNHGEDGTEVVATPAVGYDFVSWSDGVLTAARTDTNVQGNITVTANFALKQYTLTYNAGTGGSIVGTNPQTVNHGEDGTEVVATPAVGYHFLNWSDGYPTAARTDLAVTADLTVTANFAINQYTLTYNAGANGSIVGTNPQTVNHGEDGTEVVATPAVGYHFLNWSDGYPTAARTDLDVTGNITVTANFAINQYTLTYNAGANGSIVGTNPQTVNHGEDGTEVVATPALGYHFLNWSDGYPTAARTDLDVTGNITVTASFAINQYTLTYNAGANGSITGTNPQTVNHGEDGTEVTAVPNANYHFVSWSDGVLTPARTDLDVTGDITVTANFAIDQFTLTYLAGPNGSITGITPQTVDYGADGTAVTATPAVGYHFVDWSDGVLTATRTDLAVTANLTVTANFAINQYTLTYTAGPNGTLTGISPQTVNHGEDGTEVVAVPNIGYFFVNWSDGVLTAARTDLDVTGNITVTANFSPLGNFQSWAGSVSVEASKPVVAVVRPHVGAEIASYDGVTGGGLTAYVPMLFKNAFGGSYDAAFYVQNLDAAAADINIKFYDSAGVETCAVADTLAPLASKGWWLPQVVCDTGSMPDGWVGGAVVTSNKNVVAVGRPHVGAEVMTYNGFSNGTLTSYVPMLFKKAFGGTYDAAFYVQNVGAVAANVTIKFYDNAGVESCSVTDTIDPLASKGWWMPQVVCATGALPNGWVGGAVVTSDQPIVTIGRPHVGAQVTSYSGLPQGSPSAYVPMLFKKAFGGTYDAAFYVQNVDGVAADVTIKFYDSAGVESCSVTDTIDPLASKGWWLPQVVCDTGSLPNGWVGGVVVTSAQNIVAVGRPHIGTQVTTYPGIPSGSPDVFLPMLFRNAFGGSYNSAFYIQNTDGLASADVTLKFFDADGNLACQRTDTIPALATLGYWLPSVTCE